MILGPLGAYRRCETYKVSRLDERCSYDERFEDGQRLQQALMYYRPNIDDLQYTYPLDFCPIYNIETQEIVHIDIPEVRRPLNTAPPTNYDAETMKAEVGLRNDLKPIYTSQPEGVSFRMDGRTIDWQKWNLHVGFNYREGIVLSNVTFNDRGTIRPVSCASPVSSTTGRS